MYHKEINIISIIVCVTIIDYDNDGRYVNYLCEYYYIYYNMKELKYIVC